MERQDEDLPKTIGRYEVQKALGYGAMGAVYKAFDPLIRRTLAIKTIRLDIHRSSPEYKTFLERFSREARISGTLSHPNIVTLYDIGQDAGGTPFLAMEYVEGETISHAIERGVRFEPLRVVGLVSQVASALDHAHSKGIVHRDVKPSNLILFEDHRVKVSDFGIAKLTGAELTQQGQLLGTPSYMSPEQAMGEKLDGRSDIFSLGVCAFEMLSGEQPFPGTNVTSILYKLVHVDPVEPPNLKMHGLIPERWHEVFGKALAKKPTARYQTAAEFVRDLEYCLGSWDEARGPVASVSEGPARTEAMPVVPEVTEAMSFLAPDSEQEAPGAVPTSESIPETLPERPVPVEALYPETSVMPVLSSGDGAPDEGVEGTVAMGADELQQGMAPPPEDEVPETVSLRIPGVTAPQEPVPEPPPPVDPADATVLQDAADATVVMADDQMAPTATRPTEPTAAAALPAPPRPRLPLGLVLGAAGVFFVVALGVAGLVVLRRGASDATLQTSPPPPTAAPEPLPFADGVLFVNSRPEGASVSVDGEDRGTTPLELTGLGAGRYEVMLTLEDHRPQLQSVEISEELPRAEPMFILTRVRQPTVGRQPAVRERPATGLADITSTPAGAAVSIDGKAAGESPVRGHRLKPGKHSVEIAKEGYEPFSGSVTVVAGKTASLDASLEAIVAPPTPTPEPAVDTTRVYTEREVDSPPRKVSGQASKFRPKLDRGETLSVRVSWIVDLDGRTTEVKILESGGEKLDESHLKAIRDWRYDPALIQGVKVKVQLTRKYTYRAG